MDRVLIVDETYRDHPALDVAVSHAVLGAVARGDLESVFRLHTPARVLAFGMADRIQPGYQNAVRVARAHGFTPVERLAGGRAAVFHENTLAFSWAMANADPHAGIKDRFEKVSGMMRDAFRALEIDAHVGEVPGEYCPGEYSVNVGGRVKVMGVGQRIVKGAAHIGGVIVVDDSASIRDVLIPTYRALGMDWDPRTVGALADRSAGTHADDVAESVKRELSRLVDLVPAGLPAEVVAEGHGLVDRHLPEAA